MLIKRYLEPLKVWCSCHTPRCRTQIQEEDERVALIYYSEYHITVGLDKYCIILGNYFLLTFSAQWLRHTTFLVPIAPDIPIRVAVIADRT